MSKSRHYLDPLLAVCLLEACGDWPYRRLFRKLDLDAGVSM